MLSLLEKLAMDYSSKRMFLKHDRGKRYRSFQISLQRLAYDSGSSGTEVFKYIELLVLSIAQAL